MARRIVVGFDGSEGAQDALALARSLAAREGASLVAVAATADGGPSRTAEEHPALGAGEPPISVRRMTGASAPEALSEVAAEQEAELIVIGSTHRGRPGRVLPGSTGERLLEGAPCAVVIAPRGFAGRAHFGFGEIGVGFDGRGEARQALRFAAELAAGLDARLRLIGVEPPAGEESAEADGGLARSIEQARADLGAEVDAVTEIIAGDPAATLADRGVELDLLVIGSRGRGPVRRVIAGSVSAEVIRTAPCPVIVVPRSADRQG
jgi:nucleotide-binding universal stress UspA family protein